MPPRRLALLRRPREKMIRKKKRTRSKPRNKRKEVMRRRSTTMMTDLYPLSQPRTREENCDAPGSIVH
jgi:hypothetical protein